ncbi:MAG: hypothetical protein OEY91_05465, partial [Nitrospirota bacterium]|nr:hypothetical protein [Nitrospirota bacterium]
ELQRTLPRLMELRTNAPLLGADASFLMAVSAERQNLLLFYQAALNGQSGYPELWSQAMTRVLEADGGNAYYRWFGATSQ